MPSGSAKPARWRRVTAGILLGLGSLLVVGSGATLFAHTELLNTDRYVKTVTPLADSQPLRDALSGFIVTTVYEHVNVEQLSREALPTKGEFLAAPLSLAIRSFSQQVVDRFLASKTFRNLWVEANRLAHGQLVAILRNKSQDFGPVTLHDGVVSVDLSKTIATVQQRLASAGLTFVKQIHVSSPRAQYRLIDSRLLAQVRGYVAVLDALVYGLPVLMLAAFTGSVLLLPDRRRAVLRVGVAVAVAAASLLVVLAVIRALYVNAAAGHSVSRDAATAVFDTLLRYLHGGAVVVVGVGTLIAASAWLSGQSAVAQRIRDTVRAALASVRTRTEAMGWRPGPVAAYVAAHRAAARVAATAGVFIVFEVWNRPTVTTVVVLVVVLLALFGLIEVLGRAGSQRDVAGV